MNGPRQNLWDWSLGHYALDGASDVLIDGQDRFDLNVNIILWCCWCADRGRLLSGLELRNAIIIAQTWSIEVTSNLRRARRALRLPKFQAYMELQANQEETGSTLYATIKKAELSSEKLELSLYEAIGIEADEPSINSANAQDKTSIISGLKSTSPNLSLDAIKSLARRNIAIYISLIGVSKFEDFSISMIEKIVDCLFVSEQKN